MSTLTSMNPDFGDWVGAAFGQPVLSTGLALVLAGVLAAFIIGRRSAGGSRSGSVESRDAVAGLYPWETRSLIIAASGLIGVPVLHTLVRAYVTDFGDGVVWWRFIVPLAVAALGLGVLLSIILIRGVNQVVVPVAPTRHRTWKTFVSRAWLWVSLACGLALIVTTVTSGMASSTGAAGEYVFLEIPIPNEAGIDPIRLWFYGWAYGVPVLVSLLILLGIAFAVLNRNSARRYIGPDTRTAEDAARRSVAAATMSLLSASILLTLASAWRLISAAGGGSELVILGENHSQPYVAAWQFAELAVLAGLGAPCLELAAFTMLFLTIARLSARGTRVDPASDEIDSLMGSSR